MAIIRTPLAVSAFNGGPFSNTGLPPIVAKRAPTVNDKYQVGQLWVFPDSSQAWIEVEVANNLANWISIIGGGGSLVTLTGDSGGPVGPTANNIDVIGDGLITVVGNPGASSLTVTFPAVVPIANGGTNATSMATTYGVNYFDGTRIVTTAVGTAGQVLTSNGAGVAPTFQAGGGGGGGTTDFDTDSGTAVEAAGVIVFNAQSQAGQSVTFSGAGNTVSLNVTDSAANTFIGQDSGASVTTGVSNTGLGYFTLNSLTTANRNTAVGRSAGSSITTSPENVMVGVGAAPLLVGGSGFNTAIGTFSLNQATSATNNTAVGYGSLNKIVTTADNVGIGSAAYGLGLGAENTIIGTNAGLGIAGAGNRNILIGFNSASSYTTTESNNIVIGSNTGTVGESNALRIGGGTGSSTGQQNKTFISGINGVPSLTGTNMVVIDSNDQLGIQSIPAGLTSWTVVTGASQAISPNMGYIANNAGTIAFSLPTTATVGSIFEITSINNATGWTVTQASGQRIRYGNVQTTLGAGGSLSATANGDSIRAVCVVANTTFQILSSIGNLTVV